MSSKINKKGTEKKENSLRKKVLTGIILAVIALEVVLILFFMVKRSLNRPAPAAETSGNTESAAAETDSSGEKAVLKDITVNWHGKECTVKATEDQTDYAGLKIEYGDNDWWTEEGFVGQYTVTEKTASAGGVTEEFSELIIYGNGNVVWITDDTVYSGELIRSRYYGAPGHGYVKSEDDQMPRAFELEFVKPDGNGAFVSFAPEEETDPAFVRVFCAEQEEPDPLDEICVYLERIEEQASEG
ncbi:MAG: hypothetical protein IJJ50_02390 [Lachnospiraceae bacterium]|nr:hypothetical protein [Lachnospiraceae bacterium]